MISIYLIAAIVGVILMFLFFFGLIILERKKGNIDYIICQTYLGGQRWYMLKGMVDKKNDGSFLAEHVIFKGGKHPIGLFHQKHLKHHLGKRYMMILEEWDVGRYRPLEYRGHLKGKTKMIRRITNFDDKGDIIRDKKGNIDFTDKEEIIDNGRLKATPNHDIDWIIRRKEKNRELLLKKEEKWKWLPALAAGGLLIISGLMMVAAWMYLADYSENLESASKNFGNHQDPKVTTDIVLRVLYNQSQTSIKDVDKPPTLTERITGG